MHIKCEDSWAPILVTHKRILPKITVEPQELATGLMQAWGTHDEHSHAATWPSQWPWFLQPMDGQTENPIVLQFQFCMRTLYTSMSVNKISHHPLHKTCRFLERERERDEDMDQIQNKTCCHQGMIFLKDNRKTETELQALHITVQLHTNNFVIASAAILLIQSPVLQNQITRRVVFDWRSLGVMRVYKSSY